ncbi:hypothetical protein E4T56_gene1697 [Termitomyces sp. T112]|nr:hypothetical protein E4T56_gene1697 [Termitomyces sp. T112]KNZ76549.1 hypothetical protein J132_09831 [Termitomyces sp. J132]
MIASKEGEEDVEMTLLATVAEVEWEASDMEVKREGELEAAAIVVEKDEGAKETKVYQQVGDNELEWLGKDLAWPTLLVLAVLLLDFNKRVAGVEQQFQRELEAAREELVAARAWYAVTKQTLATLARYWCNCQAFLAWQEENNIREGDWEEEGLVEVPNDNADLDS